MRTFLFAALDTSVRQKWIFPRVDVCDGTEPSITDLLANNPNRLYDLSRNEIIGNMVSGCEFNSGDTSIEFDGVQHFKIVEKWGGVDGLKERQEKDNIKNEYCKNNNIHLLRIKYNENINIKLFEYFNCFCDI